MLELTIGVHFWELLIMFDADLGYSKNTSMKKDSLNAGRFMSQGLRGKFRKGLKEDAMRRSKGGY